MPTKLMQTRATITRITALGVPLESVANLPEPVVVSLAASVAASVVAAEEEVVEAAEEVVEAAEEEEEVEAAVEAAAVEVSTLS